MSSMDASKPELQNQEPRAADDQANGDHEEDDNRFQKAIASWRTIDLTNLVPKLDTTAADLAEQQREALVERKELAEKTKAFRRLDDSAKLSEVKTLLKAYQTYIDLVSNQNKSVSSAFFSIYSPLAEAPDPYPLLEASVDSLVAADHTVPKLEEENRRLKVSKDRVTSQLEESEKQVEQERRARAEVEQSREGRVKEVEEKWFAVVTEKESNWQAREKSLEERAENQERLLKELKASYEVNARLDQDDSGNVALGTATAAEVEMLSTDLERANTRLAEVQARNEQMRLQLAQNASQSSGSQRPGPVEDEPAYLRLRSENSSLLRKLDSSRLERDTERRELEDSMRSLRRDAATLKTDNESLKSRIERWSDYEEVRKELEVLKSIEFSTGADEDVGDEVETAGSTGDQSQKLEQLLMARNKKLNDELTLLRVSHRDLTQRLETLQDELSDTNMELERSKNLTATLESDLERLQTEASHVAPALSMAGTYASRYPAASQGRRGGRVSPTSSIISGFDGDSLRGGGEGGGGSPGILPMVTAQRDRFKKRITELETELSKNYQAVQSLRNEVASLQKDNLNLYEKTRYASTFNRGASAGSGSAFSTNPNPSTISIGDTVSDRYQPAYEAKISPFAQFRGRESARALKRMSLPEKLIFQVTRMVLATRTSRNLFAMYCLGLHILVVGMLYYVSSVTMDQTVVQTATDYAGRSAAEALTLSDVDNPS